MTEGSLKFEGSSFKKNQSEELRKKKKKQPVNHQKLYSKRRGEKETTENIFEETMAKSFPYLLGEKNVYILEKLSKPEAG